MWWSLCEVFIIVQFWSYFNAALAQERNINLTQVIPAPYTAITENLIYL